MAEKASGPVAVSIEAQVPRVAPGPDGRPVDGVEVHFTTAKGNRSSVFVPRSTYSVENVAAAVRQHAAELDAVSDLKQV